MIPIYLVAALIFSWGENAIKSEIKSSAASRINFLKNTLESEIYRIKTLQGSIVNDRSLNELVNEHKFVPEFEYYIMVSNVQQRLILMKNSSSFIDDVTVHIPGMNKKISVNNGYQDLNQKDYETMLRLIDTVPHPIIFDNSKAFILMAFPVTSINREKKPPAYIVEIQLSKKILGNSLGVSNTYSDSHIVLYDHTMDQCIIGTVKNIDYQGIISDIARKDDSANKDVLAEIEDEQYFVVNGFSEYLNVSIAEFIPLDSIFKIPNRYRGFLWIFFMLSVVVLGIYSFSTYKFVHYPIRKILNEFKNIEKGNLKVNIKYKTSNEFMDLYEGFNKMVSRLDGLIEKVYVQEILAKKMELKQLQAQINPHFLYNSYFILHRMIKERDFENAANLSTYMGKHFQYITRNALDEVFLHKEVEQVKNYVEIQILRFSGRLTIKFGPMEEKFNEILVPRMILQPILENAIEHGMRNSVKDSFIEVSFQDHGSGLDIVIEDNGHNTSDDSIEFLRSKLTEDGYNAEITGFINVHRRIRLKYGEKSGLWVARSELGGLKVVIHIIVGRDS